MSKGTIALDIDGTITGTDHLIPDPVAAYFEVLQKEGWQFILITGRIFSFAMLTLTKLNFPFLLGVQNGADLFIMPGKKRVNHCYFKQDLINLLDKIYQGKKGDFIVYSGVEKGDFCYYRPEKHSREMLTYLEKLMKLSREPWRPVETFDIKDQSSFPLIKCFGLKQECEAIEKELAGYKQIKASVIQDRLDPSLYIVLITHKQANKGSAVQYFVNTFNLSSPLIVGGDDNNDIPLLRVGDMRIAMDGAPDQLQNLANIIAPPANRGGIVEGIQEAIKRLES